ncbi:MAG: DNA methyltransferase [Bacteroidota bacterium]
MSSHIEYKEENSVLKSEEIYNLIKSSIHLFNEEDDFYFKPKSILDWYYEWDFKEYNPNIYSHGFHQYPAKFIPQLARKILRVFTNHKSIILDNFMGSGTTLIESMLLNRKKAIGIEYNPFACFIAKVKTTPINPNLLLKTFNEIKDNFNKNIEYKIHSFFNIDFWFKEQQKNELSKLKFIINQINNNEIKNFFFICMSEVVRRVSLTNHNGFKLHRDKQKLLDNFNPSVFWHFENVFNRNYMLMADFFNQTKNVTTEINIIQGDSRIRQSIPENSIDFILTSPPYGDSRTTVAYGQFSRLSWQWISGDNNIYKLDDLLLGGQIIKNKNINEILEYSPTLNAQYKEISLKDVTRANQVLTFYKDFYETFIQSHFYLKKNGYYVLVTGNRTVKGIFLRTDKIISELGKKLGFKTEKILYRKIINKRMPSKNSPTNKKGELSNTMHTENIIFLKKIY